MATIRRFVGSIFTGLRRGSCGLFTGHRRHLKRHKDGDRWICACGAETRANTDEALS